MFRIISLVLFSLLLTVNQGVFANEQPKNNVNDTKNIEEEVEDYNFDENSFYISDEQMKATEEANEIEDKTDLETKVINSSHFSSGTATRTYIPLFKNKK